MRHRSVPRGGAKAPLSSSSKLVPALGWTLLASALLSSAATETRAEPPGAAPSCGQQGHAIFDKDTFLSDIDGRKLARFSGGESAVVLLAPPVDGSDLAHIETGTGRGSFRVRGFVKASELHTYTSSSVAVVGNHVAIAQGTRVTAAGSSGGKVRIEKQLSTPFNQRFAGLGECSALTFSPPSPAPTAMPVTARVFLMKVPLLELYGEMPPTGAPIFTLRRSPEVDSVRFFSTEQRGGYVHVRYEGDVSIDAWAKAGDLLPLPRGETSDVAAGSYRMSTPPQLQMPQAPRVVKTTRELPLRVAAKESEAPIGVIEPETDVYVMDTIAGWASVLPKSLHILPAGALSFWVKSADLGL